MAVTDTEGLGWAPTAPGEPLKGLKPHILILGPSSTSLVPLSSELEAVGF